MPDENLSVVVICKDAASTIEKVLFSAFLLSDDVVVVDSGSTDGTLEKVAKTNAVLKRITWTGYGNAKNIGNMAARYNWIVSIDADEVMDEQLIAAVKKADLSNETNVFTFLRLNYLGQTPIYYGEWRNDIVLRVFNRNNASWDVSALHEELLIKQPGRVIKLKGILHHFTTPDIETYKLKLQKYALLSADKYYQRGKKAPWIKLYFSPVVNFMQGYILKAGFLNGKKGFQLAVAHAAYTFKKYRLLKAKQSKRN